MRIDAALCNVQMRIDAVSFDVPLRITAPFPRFIHEQNAVHMIRHDHEFAQSDKWEMIRDVGPALIRDCTDFGMVHDAITDFPEMIGAKPGANRDEIHPRT
jgi:hypothetical protein